LRWLGDSPPPRLWSRHHIAIRLSDEERRTSSENVRQKGKELERAALWERCASPCSPLALPTPYDFGCNTVGGSRGGHRSRGKTTTGVRERQRLRGIYQGLLHRHRADPSVNVEERNGAGSLRRD
jgi:hypothetical protein